jgi:hypothetical protein
MRPETWVSPIHDRLAGKAPADRQPVKAVSRRNLVAPRSPAAFGLPCCPGVATALLVRSRRTDAFFCDREALVPSHPIGCIIEKTGAVLHCIKCT